MTRPIRILGLAGSLRQSSLNAGLLRAAALTAPAGVEVEILHLGRVPLFDLDVEAAGRPAPVVELRERIAAADGILFACPEYNASIPGVLKNAIDWASRAPDAPLSGKPAALMGTSPGRFGTVNAQGHLREVCVYLGMPTVVDPKLYVPNAKDLFEADGTLTDGEVGGRVRAVVEALAELIRRTGDPAPRPA